MTSLLVVNAGSRLSQGMISQFYKNGTFNKIVCADLYPSYGAIQRHFNFTATLKNVESSSTLSDSQFQTKQDLRNLVMEATHVLYVTHDYYRYVPSKTSLLKNTAELVKQNHDLQQFVVVSPKEYDHMHEPQGEVQDSEIAAREAVPIATTLKCDLTFGPDSTILRSITKQLKKKQYFTYYANSVHPNPIHSQNVIDSVSQIFVDKIQGEQYCAFGQEEVQWNDILAKMTTASDNWKLPSYIHKVLNPLSSNVFTEQFFTAEEFNQAQFIANYVPIINHDDKKNFTQLGVKPLSFEDNYRSTFIADAVESTDEIEGIKNAIYSL